MLEECIKNCNTVPGMYKQYFPTSTNIGAAQTDTCLEDVLKNTSMQVTCHKNCRTQPCDEELHEATVVHTSSTEERNELQMGFTFPSLSETRITEQAAYSWEDLFANFGGCIGLMNGASVLSLVEISVYIVLYILECFS